MYAPSDEIIDLSTVTPVACHRGDAIVVGPPGEPGPAGEGLPTGGAAGEVLAKLSGDDYDTTWTAASAPGLHGSTHEAGGTDEVTITEAQVSGLVADNGDEATVGCRPDDDRRVGPGQRHRHPTQDLGCGSPPPPPSTRTTSI